jgi:acetolactate synthase-1/2/3 large subunit
LKVADWISNFLIDNGITHAYQLSGGMTAFLADSMAQTPGIQVISMRHEQAAGFAAEGFSRVTGIPAVAMGTSGPGATNLVTAIASAYFDSVPVIFITGQVHQDEIKKNYLQRQNGFQELDIVRMSKGITKFSRSITAVDQVSEVFHQALTESTSGRPGPVLIDIPINIQQQEITREKMNDPINHRKESRDFTEILTLISNSKRPLILAGGGIRIANATTSFLKFVQKFQIPVVTSLMGIDSISSESKYKIGMIGSYGNRWANRAMLHSDLLLVLGSRLDIRQTGADVESFTKNKVIVRIDIDESEIGGRIESDVAYISSLNAFFDFMEKADYLSDQSHLDFLGEAEKFAKENKQENEQVDLDGINPSIFMQMISDFFSTSSGYIVDVGQHQMWAAQSLTLKENQRFLTSGGLGAMGFSIPAAIGAWHANSGKWVVILGDGCAQISMSEFQTIKSIQPNLVVMIMNNHQQGMVAQFQEENLDSRFVGTRTGYSTPNFARVAEAFGIRSFQINSLAESQNIFEMINTVEEPVIVEVNISQNAKALPKNAFAEQ